MSFDSLTLNASLGWGAQAGNGLTYIFPSTPFPMTPYPHDRVDLECYAVTYQDVQC